MTWNCRGKQTMAAMARKVNAIHSMPAAGPPNSNSFASSGRAAARAKISPKPSNSTRPANSPTATKATSFTIDSKAMAATMPSCRSLASILRVPNKTAKSASTAATHSSVLRKTLAVWLPSPKLPWYSSSTLRLVETALSCSAMYGTLPMTAITLTSPATAPLLPKREASRSAIEVMRCAFETRRIRLSSTQPRQKTHVGGRGQEQDSAGPHGSLHLERRRRSPALDGQCNHCGERRPSAEQIHEQERPTEQRRACEYPQHRWIEQNDAQSKQPDEPIPTTRFLRHDAPIRADEPAAARPCRLRL